MFAWAYRNAIVTAITVSSEQHHWFTCLVQLLSIWPFQASQAVISILTQTFYEKWRKEKWFEVRESTHYPIKLCLTLNLFFCTHYHILSCANIKKCQKSPPVNLWKSITVLLVFPTHILDSDSFYYLSQQRNTTKGNKNTCEQWELITEAPPEWLCFLEISHDIIKLSLNYVLMTV